MLSQLILDQVYEQVLHKSRFRAMIKFSKWQVSVNVHRQKTMLPSSISRDKNKRLDILKTFKLLNNHETLNLQVETSKHFIAHARMLEEPGQSEFQLPGILVNTYNKFAFL